MIRPQQVHTNLLIGLHLLLIAKNTVILMSIEEALGVARLSHTLAKHLQTVQW